MNPLDEISTLLNRRIGLNHQSLGPRVIEQAVQRRLAQREPACLEQYWSDLRRSEAEFAHLVDELVVPESWFFRDQKPFQVLRDYASRLERSPLRNGPLRILSAPCAAGEEPCSIAMTLIESGRSPEEFAIDAVDVSERLLAAARRMVFPRASFRGTQPAVRERCFEPTGTGEFRFLHADQAKIRFLQGNLVDPDFGRDLQPYAVIFCRNLLIYLDERARRRVLAHVDRLLVPGGLLVVGHAEAGSVPLSRFEPATLSGSFSFYKMAEGLVSSRAADSRREATLAGRAADSVRAGPDGCLVESRPVAVLVPHRSPGVPGPDAGLTHPPISASPARGVQATGEAELEMVQNLADSGRLEEAAMLCARYLDRHRACPRGLYLLGVVRMAAGGEREAETLFNQVVYLEPQHAEAMLHLAHLADGRGEPALAQRWRQRVARLQPGAIAPR